MAEIQHELKIRAPRTKLFSAVTDRMALEHWHRAKVSEGEREWRIEYPNGMVFRWNVLESSPRRVAWRCVEGPGQAVGKEASFTFTDASNGCTLVEFAHTGWPETNGNYRKCNTLWAILLHQLQQEAEPPVQPTTAVRKRNIHSLA
jgi:uncharacterized protein YndB with AHSA1/START domain